jgi:hypothetical protein
MLEGSEVVTEKRTPVRDSVVGIADWLQVSRPRCRSSSPARIKNILQVVKTASGTHPTSYTMRIGGSFPGGKAAGALS